MPAQLPEIPSRPREEMGHQRVLQRGQGMQAANLVLEMGSNPPSSTQYFGDSVLLGSSRAEGMGCLGRATS